ncbi:MAG: phosphate/phosphite/phosphonate ABC transporter substrate-binding protein [Campylobacterales bacterium]|nr:phosphate/phosphite/phosphonate ABC transporter substrate-binding protein [Campylobacterales bacterium]
MLQYVSFFLLFFGTLVAKEYTFAVYPSNSPAKVVQALTPLMEYLHHQTGETFRLVITKDYEEIATRIRENSVDFAWLNTKNYVLLQDQIPSLSYLATYQERSKSGKITPYYHAFIIALKEANIHTLHEAKERHFAFTDKDSTSGYAYPMMLFHEQDINPYTFFSKVFFLKKHDNIPPALINRSIDLGAVSDGTYYTAKEDYGDIFSIVAMSKPIPLDAIVATTNVPLDFQKRVQHALESVSEDAPAMLAFREHLGWASAGFARQEEDFYASFKHALQHQTP